MVEYTKLVEAAKQAAINAYVPYSKFHVGSALVTKAGKVYLGANIENAAYSMCLCAERSAIAGAWSAGEREFAAMAVIADTPEPVTPCGMCRQFLFELLPDMPLVLANMQGQQRVTTPRALLPDGFGPSDLDFADQQRG